MLAFVLLTSLSGCFLRPVKNDGPVISPEETGAGEEPSGSGGFFSNLNKPGHSPVQQDPTGKPDEPQEEPQPEPQDKPQVELTWEEKKLVGAWASHYYGQINGQSTSDDELLTFRENGTFSDVIVTSGPIMDGILRIEGKFKVEGNTVFFYDCTESWEPSPGSSDEASENEPIDDYESGYEFIDDRTLTMSYMTYEKVDR